MDHKQQNGSVHDTQQKQQDQHEASEVVHIADEISQLLSTGLDMETLSLLISLCESGVNPEALANVVKELRREAAALKVRCLLCLSSLVSLSLCLSSLVSLSLCLSVSRLSVSLSLCLSSLCLSSLVSRPLSLLLCLSVSLSLCLSVSLPLASRPLSLLLCLSVSLSLCLSPLVSRPLSLLLCLSVSLPLASRLSSLVSAPLVISGSHSYHPRPLRVSRYLFTYSSFPLSSGVHYIGTLCLFYIRNLFIHPIRRHH
jgi:Mitotic-spindle organizing gamma-tubulin ring associated